MNINNARRIPYIIDRLQELEDSPATAITDGIVVTARNAEGKILAIDYYGGTIETYRFANQGSYSAYYALENVTLKNVVTRVNSKAFSNCANLKTAIFPDATFLGDSFPNCKALEEVFFPKMTDTYISNGTFENCIALKNLQIGSIGFPLSSLGNTAFRGCTQNFLTINAYCTGDRADTLLANIRNGATNATIKIYAAEDTTYDGDSYAAGELLLTSEI